MNMRGLVEVTQRGKLITRLCGIQGLDLWTTACAASSITFSSLVLL